MQGILKRHSLFVSICALVSAMPTLLLAQNTETPVAAKIESRAPVQAEPVDVSPVLPTSPPRPYVPVPTSSPYSTLPPIPAIPVATATNKSAVKKATKEYRRVREIYRWTCFALDIHNIHVGATGLEACDGLLKIPHDELVTSGLLSSVGPENWDSVAAIQQRRAMHLYSLNKFADAIAAIDASDAIGRPRGDSLFDGSIGIGNHILRALSLHGLGKMAEAKAILASARAERPYALTVQQAINRAENHISPDIDSILARMAAQKTLDPDAMRAALTLGLLMGKMEAASKIADDVSVANPKRIGGWSVTGDSDANGRFVADRALDLKRAYVWAAVGQTQKANTLIASVRADAASYAGPPPVPKFKGEKISKDAIAKHAAKAAAAGKLSAEADVWEKAIAFRSDAQSKTGEEMQAALEAAKIMQIEAGIDILRLLKYQNSKERMGLIIFLKQQDSDLMRGYATLTARDLPALLPRSEQLFQVPKFGAGDGMINARETGYSQAKEDGDDDSAPRTIRFGTFSGSGPMADELLLLAAANYAQKDGKDAFVMLSRQSIKRTMTTYGGYGSGYQSDAGYEASTRAMLLDSANVPAEWADKKDRIISVKMVLDTIKPKYDGYEARKVSERAAKEAKERVKNK